MDRLEEKEEIIMLPFEKCPVCGGDMVEKEVKKCCPEGKILLCRK